jgi:hypothetical protein
MTGEAKKRRPLWVVETHHYGASQGFLLYDSREKAEAVYAAQTRHHRCDGVRLIGPDGVRIKGWGRA